jgi:NIL domain
MTNILPNSSSNVQIQVRILITEKYHQEPIISRLVSDYHLTVTIKSAVLGANGAGGGWFDLNLEGLQIDIDRALQYFQDLNINVWSGEERKDNW